MTYSKETYLKVLTALAALRETLPEKEQHAVDFVAEAIAEKADRDTNEPLTLERLREMDFRSDPIWDSCLNVWCAVRTELSTDQKKSIYYFGGGNRPLEANRFYSRKPEGELL